jgi:hypothetical protein
MVIQFINIFHYKALQYIPKLGFSVWKKHLATLLLTPLVELKFFYRKTGIWWFSVCMCVTTKWCIRWPGHTYVHVYVAWYVLTVKAFSFILWPVERKFLTTWVFLLGVNLAPRGGGKLYPVRKMSTTSFIPRGEHSLMLRRMKMVTEDFHR